MKTFLILGLIALTTACASKKKSYCDLVEKPVTLEPTAQKTDEPSAK